MKAIAALLLTAVTVPSFGALPPYWSRAREMEAILKDMRVHDRVTDVRFRDKATGVVDSISVRGVTNDSRVYMVLSGSCGLTVLTKVKTPEPGPNGGIVVGPGILEVQVAKSLICR